MYPAQGTVVLEVRYLETSLGAPAQWGFQYAVWFVASMLQVEVCLIYMLALQVLFSLAERYLRWSGVPKTSLSSCLGLSVCILSTQLAQSYCKRLDAQPSVHQKSP